MNSNRGSSVKPGGDEVGFLGCILRVECRARRMGRALAKPIVQPHGNDEFRFALPILCAEAWSPSRLGTKEARELKEEQLELPLQISRRYQFDLKKKT
jgi:hypothetical protein